MFTKQTETAGDTAGRPPGEPAGTGPGLAAGRALDRVPGVAAGRLMKKIVHRPTNKTEASKFPTLFWKTLVFQTAEIKNKALVSRYQVATFFLSDKNNPNHFNLDHQSNYLGNLWP